MAGFILSHVMELRIEVVLGNIWEQCLDFDGTRIVRTTVKKAVFLLVGRSGSFRKMSAKRKHKLGALCLLQSHVNSLDSGEGDDAVAGTNIEISKEVVKEMDARGATLPSNMIEAAKCMGICKLLLHRSFDLQGSSWLVGFLMGSCTMFRNRMLADPSFLFKIGAEKFKREAKTFGQNLSCSLLTFKFGLWSSSQQVRLLDFISGNIKKSEGDIPVPPLLKSAALWGVFLAVSSDTRDQIVNGVQRSAETSPLAKHLPLVVMAFTVGVRYANNVYGGMQFVDSGWVEWKLKE